MEERDPANEPDGADEPDTGSDPSAAPQPNANRARLALALALGLGLVLAVVIVAAGGGEEPASASADAECVEAWNSDPEAVQLGRHQFNGHGYSRIEVTRLNEEATAEASAEQGGVCAVVFAAQALDPELPAAAQIRLQGSWVPVSALPTVTEARLTELQADASVAANAAMAGDGTISADPDG